METLFALFKGMLCAIIPGIGLVLFLATRRNPRGGSCHTRDGKTQVW